MLMTRAALSYGIWFLSSTTLNLMEPLSLFRPVTLIQEWVLNVPVL